MKNFFLAVSIFFFVLILIICFENIFARTQYFLFLFASVDSIPPFLVFLMISAVGIITGIFYALTASTYLQKNDEEEE